MAVKNVCVSTYCEWSSYGSIMQAIGLKNALRNLGYDSFIVRDVPAPLSKRDFPFVFSKNPKEIIKNIINLHYRDAKRSLYQKTITFINKNVDIKYYNDFEALKKDPPEADCFIAGSDQIWHPALCKEAFFLNFLSSDKKKFSYAASMGVTDIPDDKIDKFNELISSFDTVSVREKEMVDIIRSFTAKEVNVHIDPTFFLNSYQWKKYESEYIIKAPYILVYPIYWNKALNKELKTLHKKTGFDIVALCPNGRFNIWANKKIYDADPGQFLYLINNAEAVISASFHGLALAINYNKKVVPVINPDSPSRINSLFDMLNVPRYNITNVMDFDMSSYTLINEAIDREKERGFAYLKGVL